MSPDSPNTAATLSPQTTGGPQFRLRTLLIVLSLFAVACGVTAPYFRSLNPLEWKFYGVSFASASATLVGGVLAHGGLRGIRLRHAGLVYAFPKRRYLWALVFVAVFGSVYCFHCGVTVLGIHSYGWVAAIGAPVNKGCYAMFGTNGLVLGMFSAYLSLVLKWWGVTEVREHGIVMDGTHLLLWSRIQNATLQHQSKGIVGLKIERRRSPFKLCLPTEQAVAVQQFIEQRIADAKPDR